MSERLTSKTLCFGSDLRRSPESLEVPSDLPSQRSCPPRSAPGSSVTVRPRRRRRSRDRTSGPPGECESGSRNEDRNQKCTPLTSYVLGSRNLYKVVQVTPSPSSPPWEKRSTPPLEHQVSSHWVSGMGSGSGQSPNQSGHSTLPTMSE